MFRCEVCKKVQPVGTKCSMVVTEIRDVTYTHKYEDGRIRKVSHGHETITEVKACPACAGKKVNPVMAGRKTIEIED